MRIEKLQEILTGGESIHIEFKQSKNKLNRDVFESVCAFLNRNGGHLFLGVEDKGGIIGIDPVAVDKIKKDFVTSMNNPQNRCNGRIYYRNEDGDIDITDNTNLVSGLYM